MSDYEVTISVRNGPMLRAMRAAGYLTASSLAAPAKVSQTTISKYLGLLIVPRHCSSGTWRESIVKIAAVLHCTPESLFPAQHLDTALPRSTMVCDMSLSDLIALESHDGAEMLALDPPDPSKGIDDREMRSAIHIALDTLEPRHQEVLKKRFGLDDGREWTLEEVAKHLGVTRERVRQIESRALRYLTHPSRNRPLRQWVPKLAERDEREGSL